MVVDALAHPRYKYFPETGEERYHSFLGVPIVERSKPLGVLVVQTLRRRRFTRDEVRLLRAIAAQVARHHRAGAALRALESKEKERREYRQRMVDAIKRLQAYEKQRRARRRRRRARSRTARLDRPAGRAGLRHRRAHLLQPAGQLRPGRGAPQPRTPPASGALPQRASTARSREIERLKARMSDRLPEIDAAIFDAHRMMLEDKSFLAKIEADIDDGLARRDGAASTSSTSTSARSRRMPDGYLRERAADVKDIGQRMLRNLLGVATSRERPLAERQRAGRRGADALGPRADRATST